MLHVSELNAKSSLPNSPSTPSTDINGGFQSMYFKVHIKQAKAQITLPGTVTRNTRTDERPWRINVHDAAETCLVLPHLTFDSRPESIAEVEHHLRAQVWLYPAFDGELNVTAAKPRALGSTTASAHHNSRLFRASTIPQNENE